MVIPYNKGKVRFFSALFPAWAHDGFILDRELIKINTKTISVTSQFPASVNQVWTKLQRLETLQYIAAPYATFKPVGNTGMAWEEGEISKFRLKLFGFIPMGIHTISVVRFNKDTLLAYTNEKNRAVPIWNHKIVLIKESDGTTQYTDEIEIYAGWKTPFVCLWAGLFYRHRQKKWLKLLRQNPN